MATVEQAISKSNELVMTPRDILFECPSCSKSLVVDEAAEGMIVDCPKCHISVIVPPKSQKLAQAAPPTVKVESVPVPVPANEPMAADADLHGRLVALGNKMKELQTQRAEINNRMAARINDINRDLVMGARLETSYQQVIAELNQLVGQINKTPDAKVAGRTRVNLTE